MRKILFLVSLAFVIFFTGCNFPAITNSSESIVITLPEWPPEDSLSASYPTLSRWKISVTSADSHYHFYTKENQLYLTVNRNRPLCILAQPVTQMADNKECAFFKPAGLIYPWNSGNYKASWEQGFLSDVMTKLIIDSKENCIAPEETEYLAASFNWKKAQKIIEDKIKEENPSVFYNPWLINYDAFLQNLSVSQFKQSLLNITGTVSISPSFLPETTTFSSFIPENSLHRPNGSFSIKKNQPSLFYYGKDRGLLILYKSEKNISLEPVYMPIYIEEI